MVQSVSYNNSTKNLSYEVVYKDTNDPSKKIIVEVLTESKLAYAANCPITITNNNDDGSEVEGTVLLPKPSDTDPITIQYTVMMITDGSLARYEEGIDAKRVQYRKVKPDATKDPFLFFVSFFFSFLVFLIRIPILQSLQCIFRGRTFSYSLPNHTTDYQSVY